MTRDQQLATIPAMFSATVQNAADRPALGTIQEGHLTWQTWAEVASKVDRLALAMRGYGVQPGDRVVQVATNRFEWIVADLAILTIGAVHVPLHGSLSPEQLVEQIRDCDARLLLVSGDVFAALEDRLDDDWTVVCYDQDESADVSSWSANAIVLSIEKFLDNCNLVREKRLPEQHVANPDDLATLLYTSGTTGRPRGVMLSHRNITSNACATTEIQGTDAHETRLCVLPLSHIYARTCDLYAWLLRGSRLALVERRETFFRDCEIVQPTVINAVPYLYQKVVQKAAATPDVPIRDLLGGKIKRCFTGGAALAPETESRFADAGLPVMAGYGLTESSPVVTATSPATYVPGTVGRPLRDVELRLGEDSEVLVRGPNVMLGYWRDEHATDRAIVDGWLHTGDLGQWHASGNLQIVGRKKELLVLSTGKNVSPAEVERRLSGSLLFESVCVVGDSQKCLGALIVPNPEALRETIRAERLWVWSRKRAVTHPKIRALFRDEIDRLLVSASHEEQIGPFVILDRAFSVERGEKTAKLSLRRSTIAANFSGQIAKMFDG